MRPKIEQVIEAAMAHVRNLRSAVPSRRQVLLSNRIPWTRSQGHVEPPLTDVTVRQAPEQHHGRCRSTG